MSKKAKKNDYLLELALEAQLEQDEKIKEYSSNQYIHNFSDEHKRKMRELFVVAEKKERAVRRNQRLARMIASIIVILFVSTITIANVEAFRIPVLNLFLRLKEDSTMMGVDNNKNYNVTEKFNENEPQYMPEGFSIKNVQETQDTYMIDYSQENGQWYSISFIKNASSVAVDTENAKVEQFDQGGRSFSIIKKDEKVQVVMYKDLEQYQLLGNIDGDLMIEILLSIK